MMVVQCSVGAAGVAIDAGESGGDGSGNGAGGGGGGKPLQQQEQRHPRQSRHLESQGFHAGG